MKRRKVNLRDFDDELEMPPVERRPSRNARRAQKSSTGHVRRVAKWLLIAGLVLALSLCLALGIFYFAFQLPADKAVATWKAENVFNTAGFGLYATPVNNPKPELLKEFPGSKPAPHEYGEFPQEFIDRLLAVEDKRFMEHAGVDYWRIGGALLEDLRVMRAKEGASTITQQLARALYLTREKSALRKLNEAALARALERRYTKQQLIALFGSYVDLGFRNGKPVRGFHAAAIAYFGTGLAKLSDDQQAILVGMLKGVSIYNPASHPEACKVRRDQVLDIWSKAWSTKADAFTKAKAREVRAKGNQTLGSYMVDATMQEAADKSGKGDFLDCKVFSTEAPEVQSVLEASVAKQMPEIHKLFRGVQVAAVVMDLRTGDVLALQGGEDYKSSQLNRANSHRQPGSVAKPIVYATAFGAGEPQRRVSPLDVFQDDSPKTFTFGTDLYTVSNFKGESTGELMTARDALIKSRNVITVEIAQKVGLDSIVETAERLGVAGWKPYPSITLGAGEATLLQMASAYSAFANHGTRVVPRFVHSVKDKDDKDLVNESGGFIFQTEQYEGVLASDVADTITEILAEVPDKGTGGIIRKLGFKGPVAVKTGSSRDGWMAAYTPGGLLICVYVGFDEPAKHKTTEITGGATAGRIVADFLVRLQSTKKFSNYFVGKFEKAAVSTAAATQPMPAPSPTPLTAEDGQQSSQPQEGAQPAPTLTPVAQPNPGVITIPDGPLKKAPVRPSPSPNPVRPGVTPTPGVITIPDGPLKRPSPRPKPE